VTHILDEDSGETFRDFVKWIKAIPERSGVKIKYERWLLWIALGSLSLVYVLSWLA
jgi:hypothetical protein